MPNAFVRKLRRFADLTDSEVAALLSVSGESAPMRRGEKLIRPGERPRTVRILLSGWGCRQKILPTGTRQILAYLVPGDLFDVHAWLLNQMDHEVALLSKAEVATVPVEAVLNVMEEHRRIERAMWCSTLVDEAILREWLVDVGRRDANDRVGHRLCEIHARLRSVGLVTKVGEFSLPLTQEDLADSLGITQVHLNRTMARLRAKGLIDYERGRAKLVDPEELARVSGFNADYLHPCLPIEAAEPSPLYG